MQSDGAKVMIGVRISKAQADRIRQLAANERDTSTVVRQLIADGLVKHERMEAAIPT